NMFTGIIEEMGIVRDLKEEGANLNIFIECKMLSELKIDQSIAHNGVCLTVVELNEAFYKVTAIKETLDKTNLGQIIIGESINLERAMKLGDRLDGHLVQGHIDQTGICSDIVETNGS